MFSKEATLSKAQLMYRYVYIFIYIKGLCKEFFLCVLLFLIFPNRIPERLKRDCLFLLMLEITLSAYLPPICKSTPWNCQKLTLGK